LGLLGEARGAELAAIRAGTLLGGHGDARPSTGVGLEAELVPLAGLCRSRPRDDPAELGGDARGRRLARERVAVERGGVRRADVGEALAAQVVLAALQHRGVKGDA